MACDSSSYTGFAVAPLTFDELAKQGVSIVGCRWRYGARSLRDDPFEPHYDLRGRFVESDRVGFGFDGDGWTPGDHKGCLCAVVPVLRDESGRFAPPPRT